jgi:dTDP-4-amino-4,6-dideoxygalactose transaminase
MLGTRFSPWPSFSEEEIAAVSDVMRSNRVNYWTGDVCRQFERAFADWSGTAHAIALSNGTLALDLALKGLNIGKDDEVIVSPRSFIASASCVVNAGASPVFADVDINSGNLTAATIEPVITDKTRAIVVVHLAGWPCDMTAIMALANRFGIAVIEDCAQAHGALHAGQSVGSIGHVGAWSFCQDKIMTTGGEGGMVTTQDKDVWNRMWSFKDHGKDWSAVYERSHAPGFRWLHESIGTNWRMLEVQAAIGNIQLTKMTEWTARRAAIAACYRSVVTQFPDALRAPHCAAEDVHAFYRYYCYVNPDGLRPDWTRDRIVAEMAARTLPLLQGSCSEIYLEKAFDDTGYRPLQRLPNARTLGETSLMFLTHPTLTESEISQITEGFQSIMREATH